MEILKKLFNDYTKTEQAQQFTFINFNKKKIKSLGINNYISLAICADEKEYNQIKYNIKSTKLKHFFDDVIIFNDEGKQKLKRILKNMKNIIGNPPYSVKVEEGRKRALDLDLPIWDFIRKYAPKAKIDFLMKSSHNQKNNHGFTDTKDLGSNVFDGVNQSVSKYIHDPAKEEIIFEERHKDKHDWIKNNDKSSTNHTLNQMIEHKHHDATIVPENYIVLSEVCTLNFTIWMPGESMIKNGKLHSMKVFIPTSKPNELKNYLKNVVQPIHNKFLKDFKDHHIDRGFAKTIEIPDEFWIKNEFIE